MTFKTSNHWKLCLLLFPIIGTCVLASPGGQRGFFAAWWAAQTISPDQIDGLEWWIDASDATSISLQAGTNLVSQWNDKSGNDLHASQATSANRPAWIESEQNGKAVISFDGNDLLTVPSSTASFNYLHQSNTTVFSVVKYGNTDNPNVAYTILNNNGQNQGIGYQLAMDDRSSSGRNNALLTTITRANSDFVVIALTNNTVSVNQTVVKTLKYQPSEATINRLSYQQNNEEKIFPNTGTSAITTADAFQDMRIGQGGAGGLSLVGHICEIIIYSGILSDAQISGVQSYLNNKWGIY